MHQSIEAGCLESVIENDLDAVRERLQRFMRDEHLVKFAGQVNLLLELIFEEISRRREADRAARQRPAADTGEINIIRGTG